MDIIRTLNSILSPGISPVNRARPAVPVTETQSGQKSFAQTLEDAAGNDPSIAPFGVSGHRPASSLPRAPITAPRPQIEVQTPVAGGTQTIFDGTPGPTVLPDNPASDLPSTDLPIDQLHVEIGDIGDTMGSVLIKQTEVLTKPEPQLPPPSTDPAGPHETPALRGPMPDDSRLVGIDGNAMSRYGALAAGTTTGGNFERFSDAAAQGFFSDDQAGYARYLQYHSSSGAPRLDRPDFCGWMQASDLVYAVKSGTHQDNNQSPLWTGDTAYAFGKSEIMGLAAAAGWTPQQRSEALAQYSSTFQRLYSEWVPNGGSLPPVSA